MFTQCSIAIKLKLKDFPWNSFPWGLSQWRRNWNRLRLFLTCNTKERGRHHAFRMNRVVQARSIRGFARNSRVWSIRTRNHRDVRRNWRGVVWRCIDIIVLKIAPFCAWQSLVGSYAVALFDTLNGLLETRSLRGWHQRVWHPGTCCLHEFWSWAFVTSHACGQSQQQS